MRFKVDENLPGEIARLLNEAGYDAATVIDQHLQGASDAQVIAACQSEGRVLVTLDLGFADIVAYPPQRFPGFIVLRPYRQDKWNLVQIFTQVIPLLQTEVVKHQLWIVEEDRVRVRGGDPVDRDF